jgi:cytochrome P450
MATTAALAPIRPPGPKGHPLLGVLPELRRDSLGFLKRTFAQYGDVAAYRLGPLRSHLLAHPDALKHVLQEHVKRYTKDHVSYQLVRRVVGDGLLTSQGEHWLRQRRLAQPAFHRQRIAAMGAAMVARAEELLAGWEGAVAAGRPIDVGAAMMGLTLQIVGDALFGANVASQAAVVSRNFDILSDQTVTRFRTFNLLPPLLPTRMNREWHRARRELDAVVYAIIGERRRRGEDTGDLLSMLMFARDEETGAQMSDRQLRDEVLTMLIAGHETTATALTWAWALIDANPGVAARLHAELDSALGDRAPTLADLPQLGYTRMIIDETLRLYPPVYILSRNVAADDVIGGYRIPKGSAVDLSPYLTHRHPEFWPDPERFDPERFTPERAAARHKHAYIPFSTGPRMCIGNSFALIEATLVLATLARRLRLRLAEGRIPAPEPLVTLRPRGGMPMLLERRAPKLA